MTFANKLIDIQRQLEIPRNTPAVILDLDIRINELAREVLSDPTLSDRVRKDQLLQLGSLRPLSIVNTAHISEHLALNTVYNASPSPLCQAFKHFTTPTITNYGMIGTRISTIKLELTNLTCLPPEIQRELGHTRLKDIDYYHVVVDGRAFPQSHEEKTRLNFSTHCWVHQDARPGDDRVHDVHMGLYPIIGIYPAAGTDAIALESLKSLRVHSHPRSKEDPEMLYSPNNAHFDIYSESPFYAFWGLVKKEGRWCVTQMISIDTRTGNPIAKALWEAHRNCNDLKTHIEKLRAVSETINAYFNANAFDELPRAFKDGIYKEMWILKGQPRDIHPHFGRLSFHQDPLLAPQHHAQDEDRVNAIALFREDLKEMLVTSPIHLLTQSQILPKGDRALTMMKCASCYLKQAPSAEANFAALQPNEKQATHFATWKLSGCPQGDPRFGETEFARASPQKKSEALLLATSLLS